MRKWMMVAALSMATLVGPHSKAPASAEERVDLLLVLAADISRSVDAAKFKLQREGYAAAITNPKVMAAIQSVETGRIAICFVEWSGSTAQVVAVDWTSIGTRRKRAALPIACSRRPAPSWNAPRSAPPSTIPCSSSG